MPQSEDKIALEQLDKEMGRLYKEIQFLKVLIAAKEQKLENVTHQKKSIENYLNSDKTLTEN